jgi:3-deoxy-D-manno-octulosonate 8-phosphate phosphatase (KDO 8-P phosphatase)
MKPTGVKLLILDVDGVLTDGRVSASGDDESVRRFHVHDGYAIKLWKRCGGRVALLSVREGRDVARRASELGIEWVKLGIADKLAGYEAILASADCVDAAVAYVGDDLPDLSPMLRCAWPVAVADAVPAVKRAAQYVTRRAGGCGAVAEVIELILRRQKRWSPALLREK